MQNGAQGRWVLVCWVLCHDGDPSPPGHPMVTSSLFSPGLMGRAIPEQHSPHLKEQHHIRGSITQGMSFSWCGVPSPGQTPAKGSETDRELPIHGLEVE